MKRINRTNRAVVWTLAAITAVAMSVAVHSSAATHYVSQTSPSPTPPYSTPDTAAHNIQDAVDVTTDGDTVLVQPGDYGVTNQITVTNAIRLQSTDGASQTIVTGHGDGGTWCLGISNALAAADGFTLRPASGTVNVGGAVLVGGTIQNCNFTNFNSSFSVGMSIVMSGGTVSNVIVEYLRLPFPNGATVYCSDSGLITDSQILANSAFNRQGGAIILANSRLQNSVISGPPGSSSALGAAVSAVSSTVVGCVIRNNYSGGKGGGAYLQDSLMDGCIITGNTVGDHNLGQGGGGIFETNSIIRDSLIVGNRAITDSADPAYGGLGGGVYMQGGALLNCTVSGNSAREFTHPGGGGGVFAESGGITNCIIYFNSLDLAQDAYSASSNWFNLGTAIFDHSCTAPDPGGFGNITSDPQFVDSGNGDFHLASTSPCIDAGITQPWMIGARDLDGNPRVSGASVDIGAYEKPAATPQDLIRGLIAEVNSLVSDGSLSSGNGNALVASLQSALRSLNRGSADAACGQVGAFIGQVQEYISERNVSDATGQALINSANDLHAALGCGS